MNITDLNECLSELPEISVLEFYRPRSPISGPFSWAICDTTAEGSLAAETCQIVAA
jgi:hypothetical protein